MHVKQYVYQYLNDALLRIPLARWQRVLSLEQAEPAFRNQTIKIIYAYVETKNARPVYCHRIESLRYTFDSVGIYCSPPLPDLELLAGMQNDNVTYLSAKLEQQKFFTTRYWKVSPQLLDSILDKIWHDRC